MTLTDIYEQIRQLYVHERKSQRAIAKQLGISRTTVKKYCEGSQVPWERNGTSGRKPYVVTDDIVDFIKGCLIYIAIAKIHLCHIFEPRTCGRF